MARCSVNKQHYQCKNEAEEGFKRCAACRQYARDRKKSVAYKQYARELERSPAKQHYKREWARSPAGCQSHRRFQRSEKYLQWKRAYNKRPDIRVKRREIQRLYRARLKKEREHGNI